jgi:hypothetical protein
MNAYLCEWERLDAPTRLMTEDQVCRGHDNPIGFDWATWKYHCASGWAKQFREAVRA